MVKRILLLLAGGLAAVMFLIGHGPGNAAQRGMIWTRVQQRFLRAAQLCRRHQLHRARYLLSRFNRRYPPPDCL